MDLSSFDTSQVKDMSFMFTWSRNLRSLDLSSFDTSRVVDMSHMFWATFSLDSVDLSSFDTSQVKDMSFMFVSASNLTSLDLSNFDTSQVRDMSGMFSWTSNLASLDLSSFDTSQVRDMSGMFSWASNLTSLDLSSFDTHQVTNMSEMFRNASVLTSLDLSNFDTSQVEDMSFMFENVGSLTKLDLSSFDTSNVTHMNNMFAGTHALNMLTLDENFKFVRSHLWDWIALDANLPAITPTDEFTGYWQNIGDGTVSNPNGTYILTSEQLMDIFDGSTMADTFVWQLGAGCGEGVVRCGQFPNQPEEGGMLGAPWRLYSDGLLEVDEGFIDWDDWSSPWSTHQEQIIRISFTGPIIAGSSLRELFSFLTYVTQIEGLTYFDTSQVTDMSGMFSNVWSLTSLDVSSFDTHQVTNMSGMFSGIELTSLDLSNFDTSQVMDMSGMFSWMRNLTTLDLSNFDTGNVRSMGGMLSGTSLQSLTLGSNFGFVSQRWEDDGDGSVTISDASLPATCWQNVGSGTLENPIGEYVFSSRGLMDMYSGATMADTFVSQVSCPSVPEITRLSIGEFGGVVDQEDATITFVIPEHLAVQGRHQGFITEQRQ